MVFVTKCRHQIFGHGAIERLRTYFSNVCADFEAELVGKQDHVHLLINYPPKPAISSLVNSLKGVVLSRLLRQNDQILQLSITTKAFCGVPGYFASSCGGAPIPVTSQYIAQQQSLGLV
ncbi:IS200/IS605 family transposase [Escherichia coli]|nr:IS200/IS605 family transposase [Escherichia coli]